MKRSSLFAVTIALCWASSAAYGLDDQETRAKASLVQLGADCRLNADGSHVVEVSFRGTPTIKDPAILIVAKLAQLEVLDLEDTSITSSCLAPLKSLMQLKRLVVAGTKFRAAAAKDLQAGLPDLKIVWIHSPDGFVRVQNYIASLGAKVDVEEENGTITKIELRINSFEFGDSQLRACIDHLPETTHLSFPHRCGVTKTGISYAKDLAFLDTFSVTGMALEDEGLAQLVKVAPQLKQLGLNSAFVTDAGLANLRQLKNLEFLVLMGNNAGPFQPLPTRISDRTLANVASASALQQIRLINLSFSETGFKSLRSLKMLKDLTLHNVGLTDASLQIIAEYPQLVELSMLGNHITDKGLAYLVPTKTLRILRAGESFEKNITTAGRTNFAAARPDVEMK